MKKTFALTIAGACFATFALVSDASNKIQAAEKPPPVHLNGDDFDLAHLEKMLKVYVEDRNGFMKILSRNGGGGLEKRNAAAGEVFGRIRDKRQAAPGEPDVLLSCVSKGDFGVHVQVEEKHISDLKDEIKETRQLVDLIRGQQRLLEAIETKNGNFSDIARAIRDGRLEDLNTTIRENRKLELQEINSLQKEVKKLRTMFESAVAKSGGGKGNESVEAKVKENATIWKQLDKQEGEIKTLRSLLQDLQKPTTAESVAKANATEPISANATEPVSANATDPIVTASSPRKLMIGVADEDEEVRDLEELIRGEIHPSSGRRASKARKSEPPSIMFAKFLRSLDSTEEDDFATKEGLQEKVEELEEELGKSKKTEEHLAKTLKLMKKALEKTAAKTKNESPAKKSTCHANSVQGKDLSDEEDIERELQSLQKAIDQLRPREDADKQLQLMVSKLINEQKKATPPPPPPPPSPEEVLRRLLVPIVKQIVAEGDGGYHPTPVYYQPPPPIAVKVVRPTLQEESFQKVHEPTPIANYGDSDGPYALPQYPNQHQVKYVELGEQKPYQPPPQDAYFHPLPYIQNQEAPSQAEPHSQEEQGQYQQASARTSDHDFKKKVHEVNTQIDRLHHVIRNLDQRKSTESESKTQRPKPAGKDRHRRSPGGEDEGLLEGLGGMLRRTFADEEDTPKARLRERLSDLKDQLDSKLHTVGGDEDIARSRYYEDREEGSNPFQVAHKSKKLDLFEKIVEKIADKIMIAVPILMRKLFGLSFDDGYESGYSYNPQDYSQGYYYSLAKTFKTLGLLGYLPLAAMKLLKTFSYVMAALKKNKFFRDFLVPLLVIGAVAASILFLIWWMRDEGASYSSSPLYGYGDKNDAYGNGQYGGKYQTGGYYLENKYRY